jgi:hypothetical protein
MLYLEDFVRPRFLGPLEDEGPQHLYLQLDCVFVLLFSRTEQT